MSNTLTSILKTISKESTKYGDLKKLAKEIKKDHKLAIALWDTGQYNPRLLAVLLLDRTLITEEFLDKVSTDLLKHKDDEWKHISDWLFANQLNKSKKLLAMVEGWMRSESPIQRKLFWTHQYRLRWTGKTGHENTEEIIAVIKETILREIPPIQESMIMTAGWIGVYNLEYRDLLVKFGEDTGLHKDMKVPPGCTPWYLPEFIRIESKKKGL
jgi:hypothetical protein